MGEKEIADAEEDARGADDGRGADPVGQPSRRCREGSAEEETERLRAEEGGPGPAGFREQGFKKDPERIERTVHDEHDDVPGYNEKMTVEEWEPPGRAHGRGHPGPASTTEVSTCRSGIVQYFLRRASFSCGGRIL